MSREIISWSDAKKRGLRRYFTGVPCNHGHVSERKTNNKNCVECARIRGREKGKELRDAGIKRLPPSGVCERGHYAERYVSTRGCLECHKENRRKRYQGFREANPLPPSPPERFRDLAREIKSQGMTLEEFSLKMGWHKNTLVLWRSRAERARNPWIDELAAAWKELGYSLTVSPIEGAPKIEAETSGSYPKLPLQCHPIVARIFFEQEQLGWTRKKLAEKVGIHFNTLNRMATGDSRGKADIVEACFNAMGLTMTPKKYFKRKPKNARPGEEVRNQMHGAPR